jgi:hypothetical protein
MVAGAIDEAIRNVIAVGGSLGHMAGLDNFCWPDPVLSPQTPDGPYKLAQLVRANQALYDYCLAYDVPCISGKDSMKNDYHSGDTKISVPPTLLFSVLARMPDVRQAITMDVKQPGDLVEGVAKMLLCEDRHCDRRNRNSRMMARRKDHPSAALSQLSRDQHRPAWPAPSRQATVSLPRAMPGWPHLSPRL